MANVTTVLLDPIDVTDYGYLPEKIAAFNQWMQLKETFPDTL